MRKWIKSAPICGSISVGADLLLYTWNELNISFYFIVSSAPLLQYLSVCIEILRLVVENKVV